MGENKEEKSSRPRARQSIAHVPSRSNTTTDIAALKRASDAQEKSKRSRGKSLGPGGLEALTDNSINILKSAPAFQPKSILKASIPLTPPKIIPSFEDLRKKSTTKAKSPAKSAVEDLLIDFSTPAPIRDAFAGPSATGDRPSVDPFSPMAQRGPIQPTKDDAKQGGESDEQRRKAARRKSLANRRVSFAPEATLHTWSVMEMMEDLTTSSTSNSTRRQSSMTAAQSPMVRGDAPTQDRPDRPTTPVEQQIDETARDTPESQRKLHQKNRRRSSDTMHSSDEEAMSSPGDKAESSPIRIDDSIDSESDSDTDGDTAMSLDDVTSNTVHSADSSSTQTSLDERLRQAATQAGTRGIQHDENVSDNDDDQSMEIANNTITHAFKSYSRSNGPETDGAENDDGGNVDHFADGDLSSMDYTDLDQNEPTTGMTMEMTRAVGGIVHESAKNHPTTRKGRHRSNASRRMSSADDTSYGDETMDLTIAKGGILMNRTIEDESDDEVESDQEMTMEMTNVIGGLRHSKRRVSMQSVNTEDTESMDVTTAVGGVLSSIEEQTEPQTFIEEDMTGAMDMTHAVGTIYPARHQETERKHLSVHEREPAVDPAIDNKQEALSSMTAEAAQNTTRHVPTVASETGSPVLKPRLSARKSASNSRSATPKSVPHLLSPQAAGRSTPTKQVTPLPAKGTSPRRTPILPASVTHRGVSPKKLFAKELRERSSPAVIKSPRRQQNVLFSKDEVTGLQTPRVVLRASTSSRHSSKKDAKTSADATESASPRISEILSRRSSIGEAVREFQLRPDRKRSLRFEDPQEMAMEVEADRAEEQRRESGRFIMEQELDEQHDENTTQNLRGMIESMTPKKESSSKLKGRKSLAVGSAAGLLGKRPAELDLDEEDEGESTPKRLKVMSREASPVKKVHLPKPPTKEQTTGRLTRAQQLGLANMYQPATPTLSLSPSKGMTSPDHTGHFRQPQSREKPQSFEERLDNVVSATDISTVHPEIMEGVQEEKISLQQFLTMTNVHFIELSTTKRRHTLAPSANDSALTEHADDTSKAVFSAAATTLPLLELYQHATKELKSYISSGRKIIRAIEAETLNEQPAIFKKYIDARPDQKIVMDNQFRNAKTHARLQGKEGWYSWRSQLVDGLRTGLEGVKLDLERDEQILNGQQSQLGEVLPSYKTRKSSLELDIQALQKRLSDCENIDHESLKMFRAELSSNDRRISDKNAVLQKLRQEMREKDHVLVQAAELRDEMNDQIGEALRVQEEQCRWHSTDVTASKARVEKLEQQHDWKLLTAEEDSEQPNDMGIALTMRYKGQLRLFFYPSAFQNKSDVGHRRSGRKSRSVSGPHAPISLTYILDKDEDVYPKEISTESRFFLQIIQSQLHAFTMMPKGSVNSQTLLATVSNGWDMAQKVVQEINQLNMMGIVNVSIQSDDELSASLTLMQPNRSRVDIDFTLKVSILNDGEISSSTTVTASPIYGPACSLMDAPKTRKIQNALCKEVESKNLGTGSWISAVRGFEEWLQAQDRAQGQAKEEASKAKLAAVSLQPSRTSRATTQSPRRSDKQTSNNELPPQSTTPKVPPRSPLAPRTTNLRIQKKTIPVPKKPVNFSASQSQSQPTETASLSMSIAGREAASQKENVVPNSINISKWNGNTNGDDVNGKIVGMGSLADDVFGGSQPAIPPEMQEAMMHTPLKRRVGALRRSPI